MRELVSHGARLELLTHVPDALHTQVVQRLRIIRAAKGRTLLEKGSTSAEVFFVLEGRAEVVLYSASGREVCVHTIGPGDMFGEIAILDGGARSASVVAASELRVAAMRAADFLKCIECSPAAGLWLSRALALSVRRLTEKVFELSALNVQARIHCELLRLAQKGEPRNGGIEIRQVPTHAELASRIGTHREAVTREMRALSDMQIIRHGRGSLMIIDLARLQQAAYR
jgi:CRP-like cAMP-binding protein